MPTDYKRFIDKVIWGILAAVGMLALQFLDDLNKNMQTLTIQLSKITSKIEYHEVQLQALNGYNENIFRVETELGMHEKRLSAIERKRY